MNNLGEENSQMKAEVKPSGCCICVTDCTKSGPGERSVHLQVRKRQKAKNTFGFSAKACAMHLNEPICANSGPVGSFLKQSFQLREQPLQRGAKERIETTPEWRRQGNAFEIALLSFGP